MKIRDATAADLSALDPLKRAFESEISEPPWAEFDSEQELGRFADVLAREIACVVERRRELGLDMVRLEVLATNARARSLFAHPHGWEGCCQMSRSTSSTRTAFPVPKGAEQRLLCLRAQVLRA
jgi:hypothetical protein